MKQFFSKHGLWILFTAVILSVMLCLLSAFSSTSDFLSNAAGVVTYPFRAAGSAVSTWVGNISDNFRNTEALEKENEELRKQIAQMEEANRQAAADSAENERLRSLLNLRQQRRDFAFESATVLERSSSNWASTLTLSKGTEQDVAVNDCVVDANGFLVGVVTKVGVNWCTVTTLLDPSSQLGAMIFRTDAVAVAAGDLSLLGENRLRLNYISSGADLLNGDQVVTSGLGGYYPSGLVIGSVEEVRTDSSGLIQYAVLSPMADLPSLTEVFIITNFEIVA
jgi:rod shape-determining protein MreC